MGLATPASASTKFFGLTIPAFNQVKNAKAETTAEPKPTGDTVPADQAEEATPAEPVDAKELQGVVQETRDQLQQVNRLIALAKRAKAAKELSDLADLKTKIVDFQKQLKALKPTSENARDVIDSFHEAQLYDEINSLRRILEMPKEIADIFKAVKDVEKLMANKQIQKALVELGVDQSKVSSILASIKDDATKAKALLDSGDGDEADDLLTDIREGGHPGGLLAILNGMRDFYAGLRSIRDTEIRDAVKDLVKPIIETLNKGDLREATLTIDGLGPDIERTLRKAAQLSSKNRGVFLDTLQKLEDKINTKLDEEAKNNEKPQGENQ